MGTTLKAIAIKTGIPDSTVLTAAYTRTAVDYREMVSLTGGTITTTSGSNVFITGRPVAINSFTIAKKETTYQLWKEVYDWAVKNGYTIRWPGAQGHGGNNGTNPVGDAAERATRPVTYITWRDAIVWCNAYSEMSGKTPVYYTNGLYTTVVRVSTDANGTATAADGAKMKPGANGYRLPTEAEWEYAARGGDQSDAANWGCTYAGSSTVGDVAWYGLNSGILGTSNAAYGVHPVGTKTANSTGLYDMTGNVREWCWDWFGSINTSTPVEGAASGAFRVPRGGCWDYATYYCEVSFRQDRIPDYRNYTLGFRVVCGE
jgi:formylglycine-generating enzyme required for sulfatase activity